jgi:hypothetical protein
LVGVNMSSIANAYATGDVSGSGSVGGLVGYNHAGISNTYATGNVVGSAYVGGLVGTNLGSISNSFWNSDVIAIGVGADGGGYGTFTGGGGLSTVEMHEMSSFAGWSISNSGGGDVWQIYEGSTAPLLSSFLTPLTVTASNASTVFNGVGFNGNGVTYSVTPNGNLLGTLSYGAAQDAVGAGSYAITPTGLYSNQQGYSITVVSANLTIAPLALTGSISAGSSVYGSALTPGAVVFANLIPGYTTVSGGTAAVSTAGNLSTSNHLKAGSYAGSESVGNTLTGADAGDYTFTGATGNYTVTPLALTGSIATGTSVYGSALTPGAVSFSNAIGVDAVTAGTATVNTTNQTSSSGHFTAGTHTGSESVGSTLSGADAGDYTFAGATGDYTVTPLALSGSIAIGSSVYGSALTPGAATFSNALTNDLLGAATVAVNTSGLTSTSGNLTAGTHNAAETVTALGGADGANYTFTAPTGSYTVTPLALTVSGVAAANKAYDGTTTATLVGGSLVGVIDRDAGLVALIDSGSFSSKNAGTGITVTTADTLSGPGAGNYVLVQPIELHANITPATLTYAASPSSRTAGQSPTGLSGRLSGFVLAETQANATSGTLSWTTPADAGSHAGEYAIDGGGLTATNYVFVEAPANATALTLQAVAVPPPVPVAPMLPPAALSAIAQMQGMVAVSLADEQPAAIGEPSTVTAALGADGGVLGNGDNSAIDSAGSSDRDANVSSWEQGPVMDTRRTVGTTGMSLRIVDGGVRLPQ